MGLFVSDGVPTYYWAYPVSKGPREYATWSVYANTHCLGMTGTAPDPATRITDPARLDVEGTYATRYADLAHWLAGQVAIFGSLQQMQRRLAK